MTTMPSHNAEGNQVWNPSVGIYFKPADKQRESYGGIVGSLNDQLKTQGAENKAYPHNFAGIIAAIEDLTFTQKEPPVIPNVRPPDGDVVGPDADGDYDWVWGTQPDNGELWFDTRQGRLFIAIDGEYYQTNGGDGLAQVTTTGAVPPTPVIGQFWWDTGTQDLYIFDGFWLDPDGNPQGNFEPGYTPIWRLVSDSTGSTLSLTASTLALNSPDVSAVANSAVLPATGSLVVQDDFNDWVLSALGALDTNAANNNVVSVGTTAPTTPKDGDLWYNSGTVELNVRQGDASTGQWVPSATVLNYDNDVTALDTRITTEKAARETALTTLRAEFDALKVSDVAGLQLLEQKIAAVEQHVESHPEPDLSSYATDAELYAEITGVTNHINTVNSRIPSTSSYAKPSDIQALQATINTLPTTSGVLAAIASEQPDVSSFVTQADINASINNITTQYLPRTGGTLNGAFVVNKTSPEVSAFDFSQQPWYSKNTHKYRTNATTTNYATFGTNDIPWEYAWAFSSNEDFCWNHSANGKVFSIDKTGPAAKDFIITDFAENTQVGPSRLNTISLKAKIAEYGGDIATAKSDINTLKTSLNFTSKKVLYGDNAPTENLSDGDLWFDSRNLRLNVQHGGYWVFPDRVEDTQLKSALFNAINTSNDFETMKIKMLAVLV